MGIHESFSKRQKALRGDFPDVYCYDDIPDALRVQIIHILHDIIGTEQRFHSQITAAGDAYRWIVRTLRREYGVFLLPGAVKRASEDYRKELEEFMLVESDPERVLDAVELCFWLIDTMVRDGSFEYGKDAKTADSAIMELNTRFKEQGVGYQFESGKIIRIDSEWVHTTVVKEALVLLHDANYSGVQDEFLNAHKHYRDGKYKEAMVDGLKAIESTLKVICEKRAWHRDQNATCSKLLETCFDNGLIPAFWNQHFNALRSTLESGVPTARNRLGGHGQGNTVVSVPDHLVAYVMHLTASAIVFLVEAEKSLP